MAPVLFASVSALAQNGLPSLSDPAISPDGREIAFVSGGDIWTVPAGGGDAHLLVTNPATESRPLYSPDGKKIAFVSTRTGAGNIYILTLATGDLQRLTYSDMADRLDGWSADGQWIYFTSSVNDVAGQGDIFRVKVTGGTPLEVSKERYMNEFESAPSPDGQQIALVEKGISATQWWRNGHAHIDETEIWLKPIQESGGYRKLISADAKHAWPMWSADGQTLYYMSDATGAENLWEAPVASPGAAKAMTHFKDGRVLWPSIGAGGKTIVFERDFAIWRMDTGSGKAEKVAIALRGSPDTPGVTHSVETMFRGLSVSPDGKKLAVLAHGALFATAAKEGGEALRVQPTAETVAIEQAKWSPDSMSLLYVAERKDGSRMLEAFDFKPGDELGAARVLTSAPGEVGGAEWSPDGKSIAYVQDRKELHLISLPSAKAGAGAKPVDKVLAHGQLEAPVVAWSPDSQWIAFTEEDAKSFRNVWVIPAAGGEAKPISFLANGESGNDRLAWSPDGKYILFATAQRSEVPKMARIDLLPHVPKFREDEFRELFRPTRAPGAPVPVPVQTTPTGPAAPDAPMTSTPDSSAQAEGAPAGRRGGGEAKEKKPEPVKIVFEGIRERLTLLPLGLGAQSPVISPDGKTLVFTAVEANQQNLYTYSLDELAGEPAVAKQLTSTPGRKADVAFSPDSKELFYLENGGVRTIGMETRTPKPVQVSARLTVDFGTERNVVFEEAWSELNRNFWNPEFNGKNWPKLREEWAPYAAGARTPDELRRDINLLIGELNSSHSGIGPPRSLTPERGVQVGKLGLRFDREKYEGGDGLIVSEVVPLSPAAIEGTIKPGDKLVAVNGEAIGSKDLDELLEDTVGERVALGVETAGKARVAIVRPVAQGAVAGELYRAWVDSRRALVDKVSGGKIGYVHMADMSDGSLQQLYIDLDAQNESKQGVVIDVRNNNGGYINGYALDVLTRKNYLEMTPRDMGTMPSRQSLGQRALGLPTVLVTNESSLSDAEDFTEGYRTLKVGKVVGEPTAGWIIFTGGTTLIDGSTLRLPGTEIRDTRGQNMEMHPRPVDVEVDRELGETEKGTDAQLERAVQELLSGK
jgi:Tol biopolymer transport system component/C-terminal processing protease CtpA/Prc